MTNAAPLPHAPTGLIDRIRRQNSPKIIEAIASAPQLGFDANERALQMILRPGPLVDPIEYPLGVAFSLVKWNEPEFSEKYKTGTLSLREDHLARLFACACLIADFPLRTSDWAEPVDLLPRLVESTIAVEQGWLAELDQLIAWVQFACDRIADSPFSGEFAAANHCRMTRILIAVARGDPVLPPGSIASAVEEVCLRKRASCSETEAEGHWTTESEYDNLSEHIWKHLGATILTNPPVGWCDADIAAIQKLESCIRLDREER
jgi:hypothetical protein